MLLTFILMNSDADTLAAIGNFLTDNSLAGAILIASGLFNRSVKPYLKQWQGIATDLSAGIKELTAYLKSQGEPNATVSTNN
ncbi:hypothetical protein OAU50_02175 [Planctomycetota bacterium]|nr:hypothetical protein [Planctomycetota bacterium]